MTLKRVDEMMSYEPAPEVIPGLLDKGLVLLVAPEGSGKTFLAVHMGVHVAAGHPWNGREVEQGMVVYCAAEGASFFPYRVSTTVDTIGAHITKLPFFITDRAMNLRTDEEGKYSNDVENLLIEIAALEGQTGVRTKLIVFDTLNRYMPGGDENNQAECSQLVAGCDYLQKQLDCTVMLVHHMRKDHKAVRGNTVLTGAADQILVGTPTGPVAEKPVLWTTERPGKRKDRDPINQWFSFQKMPMSRGELAAFDPNHDPADYYVMKQREVVEYDETGKKHVYYETTNIVDETLVAVPCDPPEGAEMPTDGPMSATMELVLNYLLENGARGVRQMMKDLNKSQTATYRAIDRLVEMGEVVQDPVTKQYRVPQGPFDV